MFKMFSGNKKGIGIIELLVVVAILAITLTSLLGMANFSLGIQGLSRQISQANDLAKEGQEAARNIRDNSGWSQISNGNHGLTNAGGRWAFLGTENIIGGFTRTVLIGDAQRDGSSNIVESGGSVDIDTKKITVTVSWSEKNRPHNVELITYLTNWQ